MSAEAARCAGFNRRVFRRSFGIRFHGEPLHGLKSGGNGHLIGLGTPHFRIETLVDLAQGGIVRTDDGNFAVGFR